MKKCCAVLILLFIFLSNPILASEDNQVVTAKVINKMKCKWDNEVFYKVYYQIEDCLYVSYVDEFCSAVKKGDIILLTRCTNKDNIVDCFKYFEGNQEVYIPINQVDWNSYRTRHMGKFMIAFGAFGFILSITCLFYNVRYL